MSTMEIAFLVVVAAGFLGFGLAVGGLQWRLRERPAARREPRRTGGQRYRANRNGSTVTE